MWLQKAFPLTLKMQLYWNLGCGLKLFPAVFTKSHPLECFNWFESGFFCNTGVFFFFFCMVGGGCCFGDCSSFFHMTPTQNVLLFSPQWKIQLHEGTELKGSNVCWIGIFNNTNQPQWMKSKLNLRTGDWFKAFVLFPACLLCYKCSKLPLLT